MKEIDLQVGFTTGMKLDIDKLNQPPPPGETRVLRGSMDVQGLREEIEIARRNGAQVVWVTPFSQSTGWSLIEGKNR